jgi:hypothetical protein
VKEIIDSSAHQVKVASLWHRSLKLVRNRITRIVEVVYYGAKLSRTNAVLLPLWLLFPVFLILTSDWIGLLVIFQAVTVAVRMGNTAAAKTLAACSAADASSARGNGEYRAL